jgi:hypothetical protein
MQDVFSKSWVFSSLSGNYLPFIELQKFITMTKKARHWTLSLASWIQCTLTRHILLSFILILPYHLCLGLPNGLYPWGFPISILYAFIISPMHVTYPINLKLLDFIPLNTEYGDYYNYGIPRYVIFSIFLLLKLSPHILSTLFSNTLKFHSSIRKRERERERDQVSHP